ncbi:MAG: ABC transporter ATP-binding protein [Muribaculaceae bacterium]|nr:ABC transporter ATP-binding protein [Muribaculaceae bacterium]
MIELRGIYKSYGELEVLRDINLTVENHEIMTIVGPSGAGKTTLLQIAGTLDHPDRGSVCYDGTEITSMRDRRLSEFRNRNIGFIFQFHQLLPEFSAQENVALSALIAGESKRKAMARAAELLDMLGLSERLRHKPAQLSGGERQRCAIARALINNPSVIFADEPTGSLDSRNRDEICEVIARLRQELGQTFVIVTHDPSIASIADRVVNMADGRIIGIETPVAIEETNGENDGGEDEIPIISGAISE